jgi:hypothetical protein
MLVLLCSRIEASPRLSRTCRQKSDRQAEHRAGYRDDGALTPLFEAGADRLMREHVAVIDLRQTLIASRMNHSS